MTTKNVILIDKRVAGYETLIASLGADSEWFLLDAARDGVDQMQSILADYSELDSIQVISHGSTGTLYLGCTVLNSENLCNYQSQLQAIGTSLTETGDILLYGCNVAQDDVGIAFVNSLANVTGADVAASDDSTGLGGDALLELKTGSIEANGLDLNGLATALSANTAPSFKLKGDGIVTTALGSGSDYGQSVTVQADGKILVAGSSYNGSNSDFALVRYSSDGSLDDTFSVDGKLTTAIGTSSDGGSSVMVQADGKILVAGGTYNGSNYDFALVRYNSDGSLDITFSADGKLTTAIGTSNDYDRSAAVQADGKILVAGYSYNGSNYDFALVRYNSDGSLDTTFNGDGMLTTAVGLSWDEGDGITVQADGKILVVGYSSNGSNGDLALVRYNSDGSLDTTFSGDGIVTTDIGTGYDTGQSVVVQADGKILVAGYSYNGSNYDVALVRYNSDGSLDSTFSGNGKLTTDIGTGDDYGQSVVVQADGKILVAGESYNGSNYDLALVRYNSDGSLDTTFSGDGTLTTDIGTGLDYGQSVVVQADGKILVAGYSYNGSNYDFALVRYNSDGSLDNTFGPDTTLNGTPTYTENASAVVLDSDVQIFDFELSPANYAGASLTLSRHSGASSEDVFSASGNLGALTEGGNLSVSGVVIGSVTQNSGGTLVLAFNNAATQGLVNGALQGIAYRNSSDAPQASVQIDWTFSDGNTGAQGTGDALSTTGSTTVILTAVNDAPVLTPWSPTLITINEDATNNAGQSVASLLGTSLTDIDAITVAGIAIYGTSGSHGAWQYSTDGGSGWMSIGTVSDASALLLRDTDLVRWLPDGSNGTTATLSYYGWDRSDGSAGSRVSVATRGDTTALSSSGDTATLTVASVNDAPSFFLGDGIVTSAIGTSNDNGRSVTVQADGRILVAGYSYNGSNDDFALVRYNSDGSLDTTFSGDGKLTTAIGTGYDKGQSVVVQVDDKILVVGYSSNGSKSDFALVRYNSDGSLDTSFSGDGKLTTAIGTSSDSACGVTVEADGRILVAGYSYNGSNNDFALVRYNSDGSLDTTFSGDGKLTTAIGTGYDNGQSVVVQADGKILVAGYSSNGTNDDFALVRYNSDGSLDTTFSGDGKLTTAIGTGYDNGQSVVVQVDDKILVAGYSYNGSNYDFALVRYNSDGSLDTTFSGDGKLTTAIGTSSDSGYSVTVQTDGRILVAGSSYNGSNNDFALVRYNSDGSLDTTFSGDGKLTTAIRSSSDSGYSVTVQADGRILVAGDSYDGSNYDFALVRYNSDGSLDTTFGPHNTTFSENSAPVVLDSNAEIYDADFFALGNYAGAGLTLSRQGGRSAEDVFSGSGIVAGQSSGNVIAAGTVIGTYAYDFGALTLTFNSSATQALANQALQSLAYANTNDAPPASVQIDWTFNDGNTGAQGTGGALSTTGSTTVTLTAVNDAPVLTPWSPTLTTINEDATNNAGQSVASLLGASLTDGDAIAAEGIAIYGISSSSSNYGSWQYSTDGGSGWTSIGTVSDYSALLLRDTDLVRWLPDGINGTIATLSYYGWDQTSGSAGSTVRVRTRGDTTAFSVSSDNATLNVSSVDDKPILASPIPDQSTNEDSAFSYTFASNTFSAVDATESIVSYSANLSEGSALPGWLNFNSTTRAFSGTPANGDVGFYDIAVIATDTSGVTVQDTFRLAVNNVNDAPVLTPWSPTLTTISDAASSNAGQTVASLLGTSLTDADTNAVEGFAIYGTSGSYGDWQYSTNGGSRWTSIGTVSDSSALLLRDTDLVRWLPDGINGTTATLSYYGWDQTSGSAGSKVSVATRGDTVAFSSSGDTATLTVTRANDAPSFVLGDGIVTTAIGASYDYGNSVTIQADGKILVAGSSYNGSNNDFALVRYNSDGWLDTTFSGDGKLTTAIGTSDDYGQSVVVQADGKILVAGNSDYDFALVRYNSDGSLDTTVSSDGKLTTAIGTSSDSGYSAVVQADSKILVAGYSYIGSSTDFALVRYNSDGSVDTTFSGDGIVTTAIGTGYDFGNSVTIQADGGILVAGFSSNGSESDFALVRYKSDGSLDATFSGDGKLTTAIGMGDDIGRSVVVQADGKILVAGYSHNGSNNDFAPVGVNIDVVKNGAAL